MDPLVPLSLSPLMQVQTRLAKAAARFTAAGKLLTVAGGGDTMSALENADVTDSFTYISSAGGAFLEWLEGKILPGVALLIK